MDASGDGERALPRFIVAMPLDAVVVVVFAARAVATGLSDADLFGVADEVRLRTVSVRAGLRLAAPIDADVAVQGAGGVDVTGAHTLGFIGVAHAGLVAGGANLSVNAGLVVVTGHAAVAGAAVLIAGGVADLVVGAFAAAEAGVGLATLDATEIVVMTARPGAGGRAATGEVDERAVIAPIGLATSLTWGARIGSRWAMVEVNRFLFNIFVLIFVVVASGQEEEHGRHQSELEPAHESLHRE